MRKFVFAVLIFAVSFSYAQENKLEQFDKKKKVLLTQYENDKQTKIKSFDEFKKEVNRLWGSDTVFSTNSIWVEYQDDLHSRSNVDLENGNAEIEILIPSTLNVSEIEMEDMFSTRIEDLVTTSGTVTDFDIGNESIPNSFEPLLKNQLISPSNEIINYNNVKEVVDELIDANRIIETKVIEESSGNEYRKITISLDMAPNHIEIRASKYLPLVQKYSEKYGLEPELVLAVMHTESYFRPSVVSHAGALGLMQLMQVSGGKEAYAAITGKNIKPGKEYVLKPENNIMLGTKYLSILQNRYFDDVNNSISQRYCCISAYNGGPGNVSRAFVQHTNLSKAIPIINKKTVSQVYVVLTEDHPKSESREYLKKVNSRMKKYKEWMGN